MCSDPDRTTSFFLSGAPPQELQSLHTFLPDTAFARRRLLPLKLDLAQELRTGRAGTPAGASVLRLEGVVRATKELTAEEAMQAEAMATG